MPAACKLPLRTGMMPILHSPGFMMPGQLGPMSRVLLCSLMIFFTLTCVAHDMCGITVYKGDHHKMNTIVFGNR